MLCTALISHNIPRESSERWNHQICPDHLNMRDILTRKINTYYVSLINTAYEKLMVQTVVWQQSVYQINIQIKANIFHHHSKHFTLWVQTFCTFTSQSFLPIKFSGIRAWVRKYIPCILWDVITHSCPNYNDHLTKLPWNNTFISFHDMQGSHRFWLIKWNTFLAPVIRTFMANFSM